MRRRLLVTLAFLGLTSGALATLPRHGTRPVQAPPAVLRYEDAEAAPAAASVFPSLDLTSHVRRSSATGGTNGITFGQPTIAGIQGTGFEPDLRLHPSNPLLAYASVPASASSDDSWIWHTRDGGKTWKWVPASHPKVGKPVACQGGGDTELAVDLNGKIYFNDLTLVNFSLARSDDGGNTFPCNNTGVPSTLVDRQWYAIDGDPTAAGPSGSTANSLYLASNDVGQGAPMCNVSGAANNVLTVYRSVMGAQAGLLFLPSYKVAGSGLPVGTCDEGIMGNVEVSPVATLTPVGSFTPASPVKHVFVVHDDATFSKIRIGRCFPVAVGLATATSDPSGLKCDDRLVANLGDSTAVRTGANFPSLAVDAVGNLYAVWQQGPVDAAGNIGDISLRYSYSTDEGTTWSAPIQIPTPGLNNNVMTWAGAGADGHVDIAWYGTPAHVTPPPYDPTACLLSGVVPPPTPRGGPDLVSGDWSLYMIQTLNGHDASGVTFTDPILASEHPVHRGSIATVMGGLCGDRAAMGDFFKLRVGSQGEANIIYSDAINTSGVAHTMFVRQNGGTGVFGTAVSGDPILLGGVSDPLGDGVRELDSMTSANFENLDITDSSFSRPAPAACHPANTPCYRIEMKLKNLSLTPPVGSPDTDLVWLTQWIQPARPGCTSMDTQCTRGGANFHVYAESTGGVLRCFSGQSSIQAVGGGVTMTYPPALPILGITATGACVATTGAGGTIAIEVPIADVSLPPSIPALDSKLYSITASTMTLNEPSDTVPGLGEPPDVIDVAPGYDFAGVPTGAAVVLVRPQLRGRLATVRWRTASEVGIAGFDVYRGQTRLNRKLVPAHGGVAGHAYVWRGRVPRGATGRFRVALVTLS